jgi:5'-nucleotidase
MRVLLTNDDGVHAEGLETLASCAREVFEDVWIVAPTTEQSGVSQAISLHRPLRLEQLGPQRFGIDGTPADCVFVALGHILGEGRPDLVLSGINHGPNVGYDVYYSGTVGAAREALIHGIPSAALSFSARRPQPFASLRPAVLALLRRIRAHGVPAGHLLNVNFPAIDEAADFGLFGVPGIRGIQPTTLGRRYYGNEVVFREDPRGRPYFWIGGAFPRIDHLDGTDCEAVRQGWIAVSALGLDMSGPVEDPTLARLAGDDNES